MRNLPRILVAAWLIVGLGTTVSPGATAVCLPPNFTFDVCADGSIGNVPECADDPFEACAYAEGCVYGVGGNDICFSESTEDEETEINALEDFVNDQLDRVVVSITFGAPSPLITVAVPFPSSVSVPVAGYVDRYAFFGGSVVLPCVVVTAGGSPNPCATAGGVFVSRVLTIVDTSASLPIGPLGSIPITVYTCTHSVTVLVEGFGLNQFPVTAVC